MLLLRGDLHVMHLHFEVTSVYTFNITTKFNSLSGTLDT